MATFWERAAHSVDRMFFVLCLLVALVVSHFDICSACVSSCSLLTFYFVYWGPVRKSCYNFMTIIMGAPRVVTCCVVI